MIITNRDIKIKKFLQEVNVADTKTISILFFNGSLRRCQQRLKILSDNNYVKYFRQELPSQNIFYAGRKPKNWKHKIIFSKLLAELKLQNIEVIKYKCPLKIGAVIADGFIAIKRNDSVELYFVEVEITKNFDLNKYLNLYYFKKYKEKFPIMPNILVITNKQVKKDNALNVQNCKLDLSNLQI